MDSGTSGLTELIRKYGGFLRKDFVSFGSEYNLACFPNNERFPYDGVLNRLEYHDLFRADGILAEVLVHLDITYTSFQSISNTVMHMLAPVLPQYQHRELGKNIAEIANQSDLYGVL